MSISRNNLAPFPNPIMKPVRTEWFDNEDGGGILTDTDPVM
jgi:hypothetical protein